VQRTAEKLSDVRNGVIKDPSGQSQTIGHVCFAPKATVANQNVIRRFVNPDVAEL